MAARGGVVLKLEEGHVDSRENALDQANYVEILHGDGTVANYAHLMKDGVLVAVGDTVAPGQPIATSRFTGFAGGVPHLHFDVFGCESGCESIPVTFNNASPPDPGGLETGERYTAVAQASGRSTTGGAGGLRKGPASGPVPGAGSGVRRPERAKRPVLR